MSSTDDDGSQREEPVGDVARTGPVGPAPAPGAQWDEVHRRWEVWDADAERWVVAGDAGDGVAPEVENPLPAFLARELHHADELDAHDRPAEPDVARRPEPPEHVPGAQWNEVEGRWERWDDTTGHWVPVE